MRYGSESKEPRSGREETVRRSIADLFGRLGPWRHDGDVDLKLNAEDEGSLELTNVATKKRWSTDPGVSGQVLPVVYMRTLQGSQGTWIFWQGEPTCILTTESQCNLAL
jgi:hypothetical protein